MPERPPQRRGRYTNEERAAAMAAIDSGMSSRQVADSMGIPLGTVSAWRSLQDPLLTPTRAKISRELSDIFERILRKALGRLTKAAMLDTATAPQLAVIAGICTDKLQNLRSKPLPQPVREVFAGIDLASLSDAALKQIQEILKGEGVTMSRALPSPPPDASASPAG